MGETDTTMEDRLAAITASLKNSRVLLASCVRRLGIKERAWQEATKASVATMTMSPDPVREQLETHTSSPSFISTHQVVAAAALHADAVVTPTTPTWYSTLGSTVNVGNNPAVLVFPSSSRTHLPAPTMPGTGGRALHSVGGTGTDTPTACLAHFLANPREGFVDGARVVNTDQSHNNPFGHLHVEEDFGARDFHQELQVDLFPFKGPAVHASRLVCDGIPNMSVRMAGEADVVHMLCDDGQEGTSKHLVDSTRHDTYEQHMMRCEASLGDISHLAEPLAKNDSRTIFTNIGSSYLFLEHITDEADKMCDAIILNDVWMSDEVLTHVGGMPLFQELCVHAIAEPFEGRSSTTNTVDHVLGKIPLWRLSCFSPGKCEHYHDLHQDTVQQLCGIAKPRDPGISTARVNLIRPKMFEVKGDSLVLSRVSPWDRSAFGLWLENNTPPDNVQLSLFCLSTKYIQDLCWQLTRDLKDTMATLPWDPGSYCSLQIVARNIEQQQIVDVFHYDDQRINMVDEPYKSYGVLVEDVLSRYCPIHKLFLGRKLCGTIFPTARLKCKLIRTLIHSSPCYMVFSAWYICTIKDLQIKGLMPDVLMQSSISGKPLQMSTTRRLSQYGLQAWQILVVHYCFTSGLLQMGITWRKYGLQVCQIQVLHYCFTSGLIIGISYNGGAVQDLGKLVDFHMLCSGQPFCSLFCLKNNLQYKQWDPGVPWILDAAINIMITRAMEATGQTWSRQGSWCNIWSYNLRPPHHAIAWGQAMFFGGGNVTSGTIGEVGLDIRYHGPAGRGLTTSVGDYKRSNNNQREASNKSEERNRQTLLAISLPVLFSLFLNSGHRFPQFRQSIVPHVGNHTGKGAGCDIAIRRIHVKSCHGLVSLPGERFGNFSSLKELEISYCSGLSWRRKFVLPSSLQILYLVDCGDISAWVPSCLQNPVSLVTLKIAKCRRITSLPGNLWSTILTSLENLVIYDCADIVSIGGENAISEIKNVLIRGCQRLKELEQPMERGTLKW